jgi:hypothetical protein
MAKVPAFIQFLVVQFATNPSRHRHFFPRATRVKTDMARKIAATTFCAWDNEGDSGFMIKYS